MMDNPSLPSENPEISEISQYLETYREALAHLATTEQLSARQLLRLLRSRDRIQERFIQTQEISDDDLETLLDLDLDLKHNAILICQAEHLEQLRQNLEPPATHWWWYLEPYTEDTDPPLPYDRFDWLWNFGTVACIVIATSLMTQTATAFSVGGFDFPALLSTITQGTGLVFVAGGALTDRGKQVVSKILSSLRIPTFFHAEVTFAASLILLASIYGINQNLYLVGNWYLEQGKHHESKRQFSQAFDAYERSLNFSPDDYRTQIAIGFLYEKLGDFEKALEHYQVGAAFGIPEFLNAKARAMLMDALQKNNWQGGINPDLVREANDLLERAEKSTTNYERRLDAATQNSRLIADIRINKAIADMAIIPTNLEADTELDKETQEALNNLAWTLQAIKTYANVEESKEIANSTPTTQESTLGRLREECFYQKAFTVGFKVQSPVLYGVDEIIGSNDEINACWPFKFDSRLSSTPDSLFLRNYEYLSYSDWGNFDVEKLEDIHSFPSFIYSLGTSYDYFLTRGTEISSYVPEIGVIQDPNVWVKLAEGLKQRLQERLENLNSTGNSEDQDTRVWRFLLSREGDVISYLAYDDASRMPDEHFSFTSQALQRQTMEKLITDLKQGSNLEFADFKVVVSQTGKVLHILPWQMAYTTSVEQCRTVCKNLVLNTRVRAVFKTYSPDLNQPSELGALRAIVLTSFYSLPVDNQTGIYSQEPAIFKLKVSADGQVVSYQAANEVAVEKYDRRFPMFELDKIQFPQLRRSPYADFKLEARGITYDLQPWEEEKG
jgi:tetratricopeptide (TPR) repeat protein